MAAIVASVGATWLMWWLMRRYGPAMDRRFGRTWEHSRFRWWLDLGVGLFMGGWVLAIGIALSHR